MAMTIANRLKRIASKWGVESKSHTIEDVLEDLENGLPFGVKTEMVEILPEQSVTGSLVAPANMVYTDKIDTSIVFTEGKNYKIVFNGIEYNFVAKSDGSKIYVAEINNLTNYPFFIANYTKYEFVQFQLSWSKELGETITLAIYEEQVVYTPFAQEFIPNIAYFKDAEYDNACMGIATADALPINLSCLNMTFEQAVQHIMSGKPLMGVVQYVNGGPAITMVREMQMATNMDGQLVIAMLISKGLDSTAVFVWTANGIEEEF